MFSSFRRQHALLEVTRRQRSQETYSKALHVDSSEEKAAFQIFLSDFYRKIYQQRNELVATLESSPAMKEHYNHLVNQTGQVSHEDFWQRYFWRCNVDRVLQEWDRKDLQRAQDRAQALEHGMATFKKLVQDVNHQVVEKVAPKVEQQASRNDGSKNDKAAYAVVKDDASESIVFEGEADNTHQNAQSKAIDNSQQKSEAATTTKLGPGSSAGIGSKPSVPSTCDRVSEEPLVDSSFNNTSNKDSVTKETVTVLDFSPDSKSDKTLFRTWIHDEDRSTNKTARPEPAISTVNDAVTTKRANVPTNEMETSLHEQTESKVGSFYHVKCGVATIAATIAFVAISLSAPVIQQTLCAPVIPIGYDLVQHLWNTEASVVRYTSPWWTPMPYKLQVHDMYCYSATLQTTLELRKGPVGKDKNKFARLRVLVDNKNGGDKERVVLEKRQISSLLVSPSYLTIIDRDLKELRMDNPWLQEERSK